MTDAGRTAAFYDELSADYHRIFADWDASVARQGAALDSLLRDALGDGWHTVLDAACGIGTQLLGLAAHGHRTSGSDLSPAAVARAADECSRRGVDADLRVADLRALPHADDTFDAVVCADNALPHLLTADDVRRAFAQLGSVTRPGGLVLVTTRDYDVLRAERPPVPPAQLSREAGRRTVTVQLWDWQDGTDIYELTHLQTRELPDGSWTTAGRTTAYRAWSRDELSDLAARAGLADVRWLEPEVAGWYQPLLTARA
jgi:glycine/sarcosine N-methyltransferase